MSVFDIPNFETLTDIERLKLAEELIASIRHPESLPAPAAHQVEVQRRWAAYEKDPANAVSEEKFWASVRALKT